MHFGHSRVLSVQQNRDTNLRRILLELIQNGQTIIHQTRLQLFQNPTLSTYILTNSSGHRKHRRFSILAFSLMS